VQADLPGPHTGLAAATAASAFLNAGLLGRELRRQGVWSPGVGWGRFALQVAVACGLMAVMLVEFVPPLADWLEADVLTRCAWLAAAVIGGAAIYGAALFAVGLRPAALKLS
jgi:putative peptidoglycan lipid II flippase